MNIAEECAGHKIICSTPIDDGVPDHAICIGEQKIGEDLYRYATWEHNAWSHFFFGHYDLTKYEAYADMYRRATICYEILTEHE